MIRNAIILAGGEGIRLRPLTLDIPKAMVDVNGITLTEQNMRLLQKKLNVKKFFLSIGYLAEKMVQYFGNGENFNCEIEYLTETKPLGTAGPLTLLKQQGKELQETFAMINGDNLFDLNFEKMLNVHRKNNAVGTIALTEIEDVSTSGVVALEGERITRFVEKPKNEEAPSHFINSGYYLLEPKVFQFLPEKEKIMMEKDIFPVLAEQGKLFGYADQGMWFDTGTLERLEKVRKNWKTF